MSTTLFPSSSTLLANYFYGNKKYIPYHLLQELSLVPITAALIYVRIINRVAAI